MLMFRTIYSGISGSYSIFSCPATDKQNHTCNDIMNISQDSHENTLTLTPYPADMFIASNNLRRKADIYHVVCLGWAVLYSLADAPAGRSFKFRYIFVFVNINNLLASVTERHIAYGRTKHKSAW